MELRQLRYFTAVAEEGNISRAARKIFLTQPALSRQVRALEEEIGHCLLERQAHSIRLTAAGQVLVREARELLQRADELLQHVRAAGQEETLRVGYAPSLASEILPVAVQNFRKAHPQARVELHDLSSTEMLAGLQKEELDVVLSIGEMRPSRGIRWTPILRVAWQLAVPSSHPLARMPRVPLAHAAREPLLIFSRRDYPEYWQEVSGWLRGFKVRSRIAGEYDGVESLMSAVAAGLGVAFVADRPSRAASDRVRLKTLSPAPKPLCLAAGCREGAVESKALEGFVSALRLAGARRSVKARRGPTRTRSVSERAGPRRF